MLLSIPAQLTAQRKSYTVPGPLSDQDVDAAIVLGRANKLKGITQRCVAGATSKAGAFAAFGVVGLAVAAAKENKSAVYQIDVMAAAGRIASEAWKAGKVNLPFSRSDVDAAWREPTLHVIVSPELPVQDKTAEAIFPLPVKGVSIKAQAGPGQTKIALPTGPIGSSPRTWRNVSGATVEYVDSLAAFDLHLLQSLTGDDVEFIVSTAEAGNRSCLIRVDNLKELIRQK